MSEVLDNARASLERIHNFDVKQLSRREELGAGFAFDDAIEPAKKIVNLFQQIPADYLEDFPENRLSHIQTQADSFYNILEQIRNFDPEEAEQQPKQQRDGLVNNLKNSYQAYFDQLYTLISYTSGRIHDFSALQAEGRAAIQAIRDQTTQLHAGLQKDKDDAQTILEEVRRVAAEQGVSQQAIYFSDESEIHENLAKTWRNRTVATAIGLALFAVATTFVHKWIWLAPTGEYEMIQLVVSKVLIFGVIGYMLILCARNFLSHTHNAIVNKQRQNALMTFTALVDAAEKGESKDIVLTHAAACIFSPQDTGYTKQSASAASPPTPSFISFLQHLSRTTPRENP